MRGYRRQRYSAAPCISRELRDPPDGLVCLMVATCGVLEKDKECDSSCVHVKDGLDSVVIWSRKVVRDRRL